MKRVLPKYKDGYKYSWDDSTQSWSRYTDNQYGEVFNNFVVTPKYIRPRFNYELNPNYANLDKNEVVKQDNDLYTRQQTENANNTRTWLSDAADIAHGLQVVSDVTGTLYGTGLAKKAIIEGVRSLARTPIGKRGIEVAMRTSGQSFPIQELKHGFNTLDKDRKSAIAKYILKGEKTGDFGYYNSLAYPYDRYTGFIDPYTDADVFDVQNIMMHNPNSNLGDVVDAYLYGKKIDPVYGLTLKSKGTDFGVHADYVDKYYRNRAKNIPVYETPDYSFGEKYIPGSKPIKWRKIEGSDSQMDAAKFVDKSGFVGYDSAGHLIVKELPEGSSTYRQMEQDIWKFNPAEYIEKYYNDKHLRGQSYINKIIGELGVNAVDAAGTPIIVRTPWQ